MVEPRTYSHMATGTGTVRQPVTNGHWIQKLFDCFFLIHSYHTSVMQTLLILRALI